LAVARYELYQLLKNSISPLILGGAALQRCDNVLVLTFGFSRRG